MKSDTNYSVTTTYTTVVDADGNWTFYRDEETPTEVNGAPVMAHASGLTWEQAHDACSK